MHTAFCYNATNTVSRQQVLGLAVTRERGMVPLCMQGKRAAALDNPCPGPRAAPRAPS